MKNKYMVKILFSLFTEGAVITSSKMSRRHRCIWGIYIRTLEYMEDNKGTHIEKCKEWSDGQMQAKLVFPPSKNDLPHTFKSKWGRQLMPVRSPFLHGTYHRWWYACSSSDADLSTWLKCQYERLSTLLLLSPELSSVWFLREAQEKCWLNEWTDGFIFTEC